jgi:hypothetical protein
MSPNCNHWFVDKHAKDERAGKYGVKVRRWPNLVSIVALVTSAVSLYETTLKQAALSVYVGDVGHVGWDKATKAEIIALPLTVTNRGARDAVILGLSLGADDAPDRYRSSFVGGPSAGQDDPFAPWVVPGHGSHSGTVQLYAKDATTLIAPTANGPARSYTLCLTVRTEVGRPSGVLDSLLEHPPGALRFVVEPAERFSAGDMDNGRWIPLWITGMESIDDRRATQTGQCRAAVRQDARTP